MWFGKINKLWLWVKWLPLTALVLKKYITKRTNTTLTKVCCSNCLFVSWALRFMLAYYYMQKSKWNPKHFWAWTLQWFLNTHNWDLKRVACNKNLNWWMLSLTFRHFVIKTWSRRFKNNLMQNLFRCFTIERKIFAGHSTKHNTSIKFTMLIIDHWLCS